jgi:hypothetical protein
MEEPEAPAVVVAHPAIVAGEEPEAADDAAEAAALTTDVSYEPDQERRDKFLSRFSRWAKKSG